jgi:hypothetical protein
MGVGTSRGRSLGGDGGHGRASFGTRSA